jgi:hypothetical protein
VTFRFRRTRMLDVVFLLLTAALLAATLWYVKRCDTL